MLHIFLLLYKFIYATYICFVASVMLCMLLLLEYINTNFTWTVLLFSQSFGQNHQNHWLIFFRKTSCSVILLKSVILYLKKGLWPKLWSGVSNSFIYYIPYLIRIIRIICRHSNCRFLVSILIVPVVHSYFILLYSMK